MAEGTRGRERILFSSGRFREANQSKAPLGPTLEWPQTRVFCNTRGKFHRNRSAKQSGAASRVCSRCPLSGQSCAGYNCNHCYLPCSLNLGNWVVEQKPNLRKGRLQEQVALSVPYRLNKSIQTTKNQ